MLISPILATVAGVGMSTVSPSSGVKSFTQGIFSNAGWTAATAVTRSRKKSGILSDVRPRHGLDTDFYVSDYHISDGKLYFTIIESNKLNAKRIISEDDIEKMLPFGNPRLKLVHPSRPHPVTNLRSQMDKVCTFISKQSKRILAWSCSIFFFSVSLALHDPWWSPPWRTLFPLFQFVNQTAFKVAIITLPIFLMSTVISLIARTRKCSDVIIHLREGETIQGCLPQEYVSHLQ